MAEIYRSQCRPEELRKNAGNIETEKIFDLTVDEKHQLRSTAKELNDLFSSRKYAVIPTDNEILERQIRNGFKITYIKLRV